MATLTLDLRDPGSSVFLETIPTGLTHDYGCRRARRNKKIKSKPTALEATPRNFCPGLSLSAVPHEITPIPFLAAEKYLEMGMKSLALL